MKLLLKYLVAFLLMVSSSKMVVCQDLHYSQFVYNPIFLGGANAGNMNNDLRINAFYRKQWSSIPVTYSSFSFSIDGKLVNWSEKLKNWNAGLFVNQDNAGDGDFKTLQLLVALNRCFQISADSANIIYVGTSVGLGQKSINTNKLTFDNQFNGDVFVPAAPSGENLSSTSFTYPDIGLSLAYKRLYAKGIFNFGIQCTHLNTPDQSFFSDVAVPLPQLFQATTNLEHSINESVTIISAFSWLQQKEFKELLFGAEMKYNFQNDFNKKSAIAAGVYLRLDDAIIPMISIYRNKFRFGFSYDINYSKLSEASNFRGGPEFSLTYLASKVKAYPNKKKLCPIY